MYHHVRVLKSSDYELLNIGNHLRAEKNNALTTKRVSHKPSVHLVMARPQGQAGVALAVVRLMTAHIRS